MIKHIVMFQLKEDQKLKKDELVGKLKSLKAEIQELAELEVGVNFVESDRAMDVVLITAFETLAALEVYRNHPSHLPVLDYAKEVCEYTKVVDYEI